MSEGINICTFNANSIKGQKLEIVQFLKEENIDILLVQETLLKTNDRFALPGYAIHRSDRSAKGGGTAIIIRRSIKHHRIIGPPNTTFEYTAILHEQTNTVFISCYKKPSTRISEEDLLKT